ncbi:hypothetical protein [Halocatena halophila]|uniref:hypothetical protein n=1 Tax=Halocatena halophila TaxID=2814576 RepID=UPI002ED53FE9
MDCRAPLILVAVLVLAGCSGGPFQGSADSPTVTPAQIPNSYIAPGVTERGIENASTLFRAHQQALNGSTVRMQFRSNHTYTNGSVKTQYIGSNWFSISGGPWSATRTQRIPGKGTLHNSVWFQESKQLHRVTFPNGTVRYPNRKIDGRHRFQQVSGLGEPLSNTSSQQVASVETKNDTAIYRITGSFVPADNNVPEATHRTPNRSFALTITKAGIIRNITMQTERTERYDRSINMSITYRFETGVELPSKPDWVAMAKEHSTNRTTP